MGKKVYPAEMIRLAGRMNSVMQGRISAYENAGRAAEQISADEIQAGAAVDGIRMQMICHALATRGLALALRRIMAENRKLIAVMEMADGENLIEDDLMEQITVLKKQNAEYENTLEELNAKIQDPDPVIDAACLSGYLQSRDSFEALLEEGRVLLKALREKLKTLRHMEQMSARLFTEVTPLFASCLDGLTALEGSWDGRLKRFDLQPPDKQTLLALRTQIEKQEKIEVLEAKMEAQMEAYGETGAQAGESVNGTVGVAGGTAGGAKNIPDPVRSDAVSDYTATAAELISVLSTGKTLLPGEKITCYPAPGVRVEYAVTTKVTQKEKQRYANGSIEGSASSDQKSSLLVSGKSGDELSAAHTTGKEDTNISMTESKTGLSATIDAQKQALTELSQKVKVNTGGSGVGLSGHFSGNIAEGSVGADTTYTIGDMVYQVSVKEKFTSQEMTCSVTSKSIDDVTVRSSLKIECDRRSGSRKTQQVTQTVVAPETGRAAELFPTFPGTVPVPIPVPVM